jgi:hypothetical protein
MRGCITISMILDREILFFCTDRYPSTWGLLSLLAVSLELFDDPGHFPFGQDDRLADAFGLVVNPGHQLDLFGNGKSGIQIGAHGHQAVIGQ